MPFLLTLADYRALRPFVRTAAVRSPTNQKAREAYARMGVLAGFMNKSMSQVERMADTGDLSPEAIGMLESPGYSLWGQVIKGANSALKSSVVDEASEMQPGLHGTSGEGMAQVMSVGGLKWPGKRLDFRFRAYPDAPAGTQAAKVKGLLMDRDEPVFKAGDNIFMEVGRIARGAGKDVDDFGFYLQTLFNRARTLTRSWVRSVKPFETVPLPAREREMEMLVPGYDGPGDITAMTLSNPYFIKAIDDEVSRLVANNPAQKWLWGAITSATGKGNKPFVRPVKGGTPPLSLEASKLMRWVEDNGYPDPPGGRRSVAKAWTKLYKQMLKAYDNLSDSVIDRGLAKGPASTLFRDPAVRDVYLQEIRRRRASAAVRRVAARRVAARRVAEKWAGLLGPVEKGLLDVLKNSPTQSSIIEDEDMRAATTLVQKGLAEWFTDFELALTDQGRRKKAALGPTSLGEMMLSAVAQIRLFHNLEGAYDRYLGVYEEMGQNLVRMGHTTDPEDREFLVREIDSGLKYLRGRAGEIHRAAEALKKMADAYDLVAKAYR